MSICGTRMTLLQRRAMRRVGAALLIVVALTAINDDLVHHSQVSMGAVRLWSGVLSLVVLLPLLFAIWAIGRYLKAEPDEFVRALLVQSLLWGMAAGMVVDVGSGLAFDAYGRNLPLLSVDCFFVATGLAFRLLQRSYR
jgi:hypothetical protein